MGEIGRRHATGFWVIALTVGFELITCLLRFGFHRESTRDTGVLAAWTFGMRIHHAYLGGILLLVATRFARKSKARRWLVRIGAALVCSDLIHHFLVLWPVTGSPQFDVMYPPSN